MKESLGLFYSGSKTFERQPFENIITVLNFVLVYSSLTLGFSFYTKIISVDSSSVHTQHREAYIYFGIGGFYYASFANRLHERLIHRCYVYGGDVDLALEAWADDLDPSSVSNHITSGLPNSFSSSSRLKKEIEKWVGVDRDFSALNEMILNRFSTVPEEPGISTRTLVCLWKLTVTYTNEYILCFFSVSQ